MYAQDQNGRKKLKFEGEASQSNQMGVGKRYLYSAVFPLSLAKRS
jgi:hypothetical protein